MQEGRDIERAPIVDGAHDLARHRVLDGELSALDPAEKAAAAALMLVHREVMIHVELHHRYHAPEIGNEAAKYASLIHLAQHALRIAGVHKEPHEKPIGGRIVAQLVVDEPYIGAHLTQHL